MKSRKFWAFAVGLVTLLAAAMADGAITADEGRNIAGLVVGYAFSVAFEDGMSNRNATTTTLTTPSDNVSVVTSEGSAQAVLDRPVIR